MPAPAVIPALIAYVKVVAVKTLVVGFRPSYALDGNPGLCPPGRAGGLTKADGGQVCRRLYPSGFTGARRSRVAGFGLRYHLP